MGDLVWMAMDRLSRGGAAMTPGSGRMARPCPEPARALGQQPQGTLLQGEAVHEGWTEGMGPSDFCNPGPGAQEAREGWHSWGPWGPARAPGTVAWWEGGQRAVLGPQGVLGLPRLRSLTPDASWRRHLARRFWNHT